MGRAAQSDSKRETSRRIAVDADLKPPLKWAGGKRWLVHHLTPIWAGFTESRLVEPFVGGLSVTLGLRPGRALLNDANPHLINFYKWLKSGLHPDISMINSPEAYYSNRDRFNHLVREGKEGSKEAAELFYYLNRTCYNGLCRFNRSGSFNTPMGRYKTINYLQDFQPYSQLMQGWEFAVGDFETLNTRSTDFVYADPPYDGSFNQYSREIFGWSDQVRLAKWLVRLQGPVVLSNLASARIVKLYRGLGFTLRFYKAPRMINSTGNRSPAKEVLALRNLE